VLQHSTLNALLHSGESGRQHLDAVDWKKFVVDAKRDGYANGGGKPLVEWSPHVKGVT